MGKSEVVPMPIHRQESLYATCRTAFRMPVETVGEEVEDELVDIPEDMEMFRNQVAGHSTYGMIKHKGTILKPITCGEREVQFYQDISTTTNDTLLELKQFIPNFCGTVTVPFKDSNLDCLVLEDLTHNFKEPCVMDIKIGRRTWDPEATFDKIAREEKKYQGCKRDLAFCIPGFQVHKIVNNQLTKFDKDYGKTLDKDTVPQALKTFLNGEKMMCRSLIVQFLASLWRIQLWARKQRHFHIYSSSLLLVYDARRLRDFLKTDPKPPKLKRSTSLYRPLSLAVLNNDNEKVPTGFSGQLTNQGPILRTTRSVPVKEFDNVEKKNKVNGSVWQKSIKSLKRTHSFQHDYDKDMQCKRQDYSDILDELCTGKKSELWATVKMIDFAHTFPAENHTEDRNYLEGIQNLIQIFEEFLLDCE